MSFSPLEAPGSTARERTQQAKANDIADHMEKVLDFMTKSAAISRIRIV